MIKRFRFRQIGCTLLLSILCYGCLVKSQKKDQENTAIRINQIGYLTLGKKQAAIVNPVTNTYVLIDEQGREVFRSTLLTPKFWDKSGETIAIADFTGFSSTGTYLIKCGLVTSPPFVIEHDPYSKLLQSSIKAYYYNRASTALDEKYAGQYARAQGHPDDRVIVHESAASARRPAGTAIATPYGWYDAGDYNKYVVNSGITTYTLLLAYQHNKILFDTLNWNIPESENTIPDMLDEVQWNLNWLVTMQDPEDGGVYHKTTTASFEGFVAPIEAISPRYVVSKSTTAALNFAAVLSNAAVVLEPIDPERSRNYISRAEKAWSWARHNPGVVFKNPGSEYTDSPPVSTGAYGDTRFEDEFLWAATELYLATGKSQYQNEIDLDRYREFSVPTWKNVAALSLVSLVNTDKAIDEKLRKKASNYLMVLSEELMSEWYNSPYRITLNDFQWGSNSDIANQSLILINAYKVFGNTEFYEAALSSVDYLLGKNATGYCFVTGFGSNSPKEIHHRMSAADGIEEPVPGWLVGGPNPSNVDQDCGKKAYPTLLPARCYIDELCSYSTNEVAINWNAPLVYLLASVQTIYTTDYKHYE